MVTKIKNCFFCTFRRRRNGTGGFFFVYVTGCLYTFFNCLGFSKYILLKQL